MGKKHGHVTWPLEQAGGGDEASTGSGDGKLPGLPPVDVGLVHNLQQVSLTEGHACIRAGDGRVLLGAVVCHGPHTQLRDREEDSAIWLVYIGIHHVIYYIHLYCKIMEKHESCCKTTSKGLSKGPLTIVWLLVDRGVFGITLNKIVPSDWIWEKCEESVSKVQL